MPAGGVCTVLSYLRLGIIMASTMKNIGHDSSTSTIYVTSSPMPALREGEVLIKVLGSYGIWRDIGMAPHVLVVGQCL